ncbi:MAG TPA: hypothetical protein VK879_15260 [Candidatus Sulfomarinibacteraceae bacterium]|nr:hypothetical protein [Candidatus Sulfomarinibacteraceae bacterium]
MDEVAVERSRPPQTRIVPGTQHTRNFPRSGAIAGAISAFGFALIHALFISDIWFSLPIMMVAGALCGLCVTWSYSLRATAPSLSSWLGYNMVYVVLLALLALASILIFEPVTTVAALIAANESPGELIRQATPMTAAFTLLAAVGVSMLHERSWRHLAVVLLTCTLIVLFLGLNISIIGLVFFPRSSLFLIVEMFGLILAINILYAAVFTALERKSLLHGGQTGDEVGVQTIAERAT